MCNLNCIHSFQEYPIAEKERARLNKGGKGEVLKLPKIDYLGIGGILFAFFFVLFIYVLLESLAEPFLTDQYAVTDDYSMVAVGIALAFAGMLCTAIFVITGKMAKKFDERKLLILLGLIPEVIGILLYLPTGHSDIQMSNCTETQRPHLALIEPSSSLIYLENTIDDFDHNLDFSFSRVLSDNLETNNATINCTLGCPLNQDWCNGTPQLPVIQLVFAFVITMAGYPVVQALTQSIYSKMIGPRPQGLWMGILTGVGSFARVTGPIFVSYIYTNMGTYYCFGILSIGMIISTIEIILLYKRLVPMKPPTLVKGIDNPTAEDEV